MFEWKDVVEIGPDCFERFVDHTKVPEIQDLSIILCGVSKLAGKYCVARSNPSCNTIFYAVDGAIELYTPEGHETVTKGHLVTLPANKPFLFELKAESFSMVWFDLSNNSRWKALCENRPPVTVCDSARQIYHALGIVYYERKTELRKPIMAQLKYYLEDTLCAPAVESSEPQRIDQLVRDIEKQLHYRWTVEEMAEVVGYSPPHLHRLFQKRFNRSPIQHLIYLRMERAKYMLTHTAWSLDQIAERVGYSDVFNFSKRFKKSVGSAPGLYRKEQ